MGTCEILLLLHWAISEVSFADMEELKNWSHIYDVANFSIAKLGTDKTFVFTQSTPSAVWTINHGLNKFPSVTSVNNNNIQAYGAIEYIDKDNLTITFSGGFSGKAYMN